MRNTSRRHIFAILVLTTVSLPLAFGQEQFQGKTVIAIDYQPAQQPIDPRDLVNDQLVEIGKPLELPKVAATIDRLWASGLYDDVQVEAVSSGDGVRLTFTTVARQFIGHVGAVGKIIDPPDRGVIISDSQLALGQKFDPEDLEAAKKSILDVMHSNGLYTAQVGSSTILDPKTNEVAIRFYVASGKRAKYETPEIKGADRHLSDETIIRATGWRIPLIHWWRQITENLTDKGVDGISKKYAKEGRLTADVDLESLNYDAKTNRAKPVLDINAGPKIDIKVREAKVSKKKIQNMVPVYEEGSVDNDLLTEGVKNITDYFQSRGYPDVHVDFKKQPVQKDREEIDYDISLGTRQKLADVEITGSNYFSYDTLRERMFLQTSSLVLRYGRYSEKFRSDDEAAITSLYQANGFRNVQVTSAVQANYKGKPNEIGVTFHIQEGPQWRVEKLNIVGNLRLDLEPIRNQFYSVEGQPYSDVNVASDRNRILEWYYEHGFLHAGFAYKWVQGSAPNLVNLTYYITEGPQEFVRGVILTGLDRTKPSVVLRDMDLTEGEPLSMPKVNDIARQLSDLGMFATVNSGLQNPDGRTAYKYVVYDFDEAVRYSFEVGLGLLVGQFGQTTSNLSQAGGAKGISPMVSFNVNRINFLGRGQTISLQTRYSTLEQRESLNYIVPRFLGSLNRTVTFSALYDTTQNVQTFTSRTEQASIATSQRFTRASTLALRFDYRRVSTSNVNIPALIIPALLQPVRIGILSGSFIQDHRDNPGNAHRGYWNTVDTGIAGGFFGSQRSFVRLLARNATYTPLGRNITLARQTEFGVIRPFGSLNGISSFDYIPLPERFFGGGSTSMRGFGDNQAGPRDIGTANELPSPSGPATTATGFPIGGNALFFNTVELRFPLFGPNITGVAFEDMGNVYTNFSDMSFAYRQPSQVIQGPSGPKTVYQNFNYAVQAPGFGIRYNTPVGPIRVDFSYALNPLSFQGYSTSETVQQLVYYCSSAVNVSAADRVKYCTPGAQQLSHFNFFFSIGQMF